MESVTYAYFVFLLLRTFISVLEHPFTLCPCLFFFSFCKDVLAGLTKSSFVSGKPYFAKWYVSVRYCIKHLSVCDAITSMLCTPWIYSGSFTGLYFCDKWWQVVFFPTVISSPHEPGLIKKMKALFFFSLSCRDFASLMLFIRIRLASHFDVFCSLLMFIIMPTTLCMLRIF